MGRSLRIVHCFRSPVGGIFRHVRDLAHAQAAAGHLVGIVCDSSTGGDYEDRLFDQISGTLALGIHRTPMQRHVGPGDIAAAYGGYGALDGLTSAFAQDGWDVAKNLYQDALSGGAVTSSDPHSFASWAQNVEDGVEKLRSAVEKLRSAEEGAFQEQVLRNIDVGNAATLSSDNSGDDSGQGGG